MVMPIICMPPHRLMLRLLMSHHIIPIQMDFMIQEDMALCIREGIILMLVNIGFQTLTITVVMVSPMLHQVATTIMMGLILNMKEITDQGDRIQGRYITHQNFIRMVDHDTCMGPLHKHHLGSLPMVIKVLMITIRGINRLELVVSSGVMVSLHWLIRMFPEVIITTNKGVTDILR